MLAGEWGDGFELLEGVPVVLERNEPLSQVVEALEVVAHEGVVDFVGGSVALEVGPLSLFAPEPVVQRVNLGELCWWGRWGPRLKPAVSPEASCSAGAECS